MPGVSDDIWPVVHAERRALAADLAGLTPDQWTTPSLCGGWSVHDVLAHMVATAKETPPAFLVGMLRSGFRISRFTEKRIAEERGPGVRPRPSPPSGRSRPPRRRRPDLS
jgi:uncharacterized protein (TIGR03083 family)